MTATMVGHKFTHVEHWMTATAFQLGFSDVMLTGLSGLVYITDSSP